MRLGRGALRPHPPLHRSQVALSRARPPLLPEPPAASLAPLPTSTSSHNCAVLFTVSAPLSILLLVPLFSSLSLQGHSFSLLTPSPAHLRSDPQMTPVGCVDTSSSTSVLTWTPDSANLLVFLLLAWRLTSSLPRLQEASMSKYFQIRGSLLNCTGAEEGIPGARTCRLGLSSLSGGWGPSELKGEQVARDFNRQLRQKDRDSSDGGLGTKVRSHWAEA